MGLLLDRIRAAVADERYVVTWHADERCEERQISAWQIVCGLADASVVRESLNARPNPTVTVRQSLADGTDVEAVWAWVRLTQQARLVTVYFRH